MGPDGEHTKSATLRKKRGTSSRLSDGLDVAHRFNALRFLALNLKSQNDSMGVPNKSEGANTPPSTSHQ